MLKPPWFKHSHKWEVQLWSFSLCSFWNLSITSALAPPYLLSTTFKACTLFPPKPPRKFSVLLGWEALYFRRWVAMFRKIVYFHILLPWTQRQQVSPKRLFLFTKPHDLTCPNNGILTFKQLREHHTLGFPYFCITGWSRYSLFYTHKFISKLITPQNANNTASRLVKLPLKRFSDCCYRF